jgi:hypothetical protein
MSITAKPDKPRIDIVRLLVYMVIGSFFATYTALRLTYYTKNVLSGIIVWILIEAITVGWLYDIDSGRKY